MQPCQVRRSIGPATSLLWLVLVLPGAAQALHPAPHAPQMVTMTLVDRDAGAPLPVHTQHGVHWVAGEPGRPYAIRLANTTGARVLVVLSVDGVNAVTGETASPSQAGYVLAPWQTTEIAGWRKSHADIARFEFTALGDSYAARTERPDNVGAIGIAVFETRGAQHAPKRNAAIAPATNPSASDLARREPSSSAADASEARQQMGTGHGQREWAPAASTHFSRASSRPAQVSTLRYDTLDALVARGIAPRRHHWVVDRPPQAFPGQFVPDP